MDSFIAVEASPVAARLTPISLQIWNAKYRLKQPDGTPIDGSVEDTWRRVARTLAGAEKQPELWEPQFYDALKDFRFLPAGRIIAGAGTERRVTLFNCFVMGNIPDDLGAIFEHLREAALTMQQGGGIGYDFSSLRPKGAPVHGVGADASGPLSFMDVWDAMCRTIMSAGYRRGAMMATLRCDHPDIEAFIAAKREPGRLRHFNLSVLITDAFMAAVNADAGWPLVFDGVIYRTLRARALWDSIMRATYAYAEPGVLFIDRINERNNLRYCETIGSTNPCSEQPLPPYGACLLGSINLAALVRRPFSADARIDEGDLAQLAGLAVRMLDNAIDVSRFPLAAQKQEALAKRRIGLGIAGLGDALILCGHRYGSEGAVAAAEGWARQIQAAAYLASCDLAEEKGAFPLYDREAFLATPNIADLPEPIRQHIEPFGIRNALLTSVAPTGTISLFADNVSSGIEPVFAHSYSRAVTEPDGTVRNELVHSQSVLRYLNQFGTIAKLPAYFVTAQDLAPADHIRMQAAIQRHVDSAISKTVNVPEDIVFEAFQDIYRLAYDSGCKGCTTFRPNEVTGSVLEVVSPKGSEPAAAQSAAPVPDMLERAEHLPGKTYKLRWPESEHALYVTINDAEQDGRKRPYEIFINSKNMEHYAWVVALTRMISAVFHRGGDVAFVAEELQAIFDPRGGCWSDGRYVPSLIAAIGHIIERHMIAIGFIADAAPVPSPPASTGKPGAFCSKCNQPSLVPEGNCMTCGSCGWSKCG